MINPFVPRSARIFMFLSQTSGWMIKSSRLLSEGSTRVVYAELHHTQL